MVLFALAACTPKATTTMADKADDKMDEVMSADFRANPPEPGPAPEIDLPDFQDFKLDNGLQVILVENHKLPRVSYQLFVDVPAHMEGKYAGTSGMMGSMLRRATSDMTKEEIDEAVDFIGANLSTSGNGAFASTISKYKDQMMEMMGKVVLDAQFPQDEFDKVKDDALAGLKSSLANPDAIAARVRSVLTYGADHPYGELETEETLNNITLDVVKEYYNTYFVPNRSYLVLVGDLTRSEAEMMAKKTFGQWQKKAVNVPEFKMPERPEGVVVSFVPRAGSVQSIVNVGHPVKLEPGTKEAIRASIVNSILGSGFNGRLFQNLREDKAYTYGAYSSAQDNRLVGNFNASTSVRNEVTDSAVVELLYEIGKISKEKVSDEELMRAKSQTAGSFGRALESPQRLSGYALSTIRYGLDRDFYPNYLKKVQASSANDLLEVASDIMNPANTNIIVVGDKEVADKLARFATSGKVNYYDVNGMPVDMAAMAAPTDMTPKSILMKYVDAIGGQAALGKVKNITMTMEAEIPGMGTMSQTMVKDGGDKMSAKMMMGGLVASQQTFSDGKARVIAQGQPVPSSPEADAEAARQAKLFPTASLLDNVDNLKVSGTEMVDGKKMIVLSEKTGEASTQYYFDAESGLLTRQVQSANGQSITRNYGDYKMVNGVKVPHALSLEGMAPFPIEMKMTEFKVNGEVDQSLFKMD